MIGRVAVLILVITFQLEFAQTTKVANQAVEKKNR